MRTWKLYRPLWIIRARYRRRAIDHMQAIRAFVRVVEVGGLSRAAESLQIPNATFNKYADINLKGTVFTIQKALRLMRPGSAIVITGSKSGRCATQAPILDTTVASQMIANVRCVNGAQAGTPLVWVGKCCDLRGPGRLEFIFYCVACALTTCNSCAPSPAQHVPEICEADAVSAIHRLDRCV
jgi:NAD(P)-dependent dehydrogenase (short-subunit alcohol dehydrogenase family)